MNIEVILTIVSTAAVLIWRMSAFKSSIEQGFTALKESLTTQLAELKSDRTDHREAIQDMQTRLARLETRCDLRERCIGSSTVTVHE